ncbi:hypothetical protein ACIP1U_18985 [Cupriavidus sp. NPDC089707]|uniref:hypothetical protein n=1 Tax=Cupriavidus sp. NPDC089707 TaxID=3363963 RepID=UPI00381BB7C9
MTLLVEMMLPSEGMAGTLFSIIDTLVLANRLEAARAGDAEAQKSGPPIRWRLIDIHGKPVSIGHPLLDSYQTNADDSEAAERRALVVAPVQMRNLPHLRRLVAEQADAVSLVAKRHAQGALIATCGTGVWWLAAAGVLEGRTVAVPWTHQAWFSREFPSIRLAQGQALVCDGPILCATTAAQQVSLAIRLLASLGAADLAGLVASILLFDAEREQVMTDIAEQGMISYASDSVLYKAIQWMRRHLDQPITLDDVARATCASTRTLLRHFDRHL